MSNATAVSDIEREEHDKTYGVKKVSLWGYDPTYNGTGALKRVTIDSLNYYSTNDVDSTDPLSVYEGLEDSDGGWQIVNIAITGKLVSNRFATFNNNPTYDNYSDAWDNRATLTYDYYSVAF